MKHNAVILVNFNYAVYRQWLLTVVDGEIKLLDVNPLSPIYFERYRSHGRPADGVICFNDIIVKVWFHLPHFIPHFLLVLPVL